MKILFLLLVSATAFAQVTTLPVCRIDRAFSPTQKFSSLRCNSMNQSQASFMNRCIPKEKPDDAQVLFSLLTMGNLEEEAKIVLRGTPLNEADDKTVKTFLNKVREIAQNCPDERLRADLLKLATSSEEEWSDMRIFDDDSAEETHLDMGVMRASLMYALAQTIGTPQFIVMQTQRGISEIRAKKVQEDELEMIYQEYPEFRDLGKPNAYGNFAEVFRDSEVLSKMLEGNPLDRPECRQIWILPAEDRIFCRVVSVRESVVNELSREMPKPEARALQAAARKDFLFFTARSVVQSDQRIAGYRTQKADLPKDPAHWRKLMLYREKTGDRLGEAYAYQRMCEAQANAGRNAPPPATPKRGSGHP